MFIKESVWCRGGKRERGKKDRVFIKMSDAGDLETAGISSLKELDDAESIKENTKVRGKHKRKQEVVFFCKIHSHHYCRISMRRNLVSMR